MDATDDDLPVTGRAEGTEPSVPPARGVLKRVRDSAGAAVEPIVGKMSDAVGSAGRSWADRSGARVRRVRRMARHPLPSLPELHPDARQARPVEVGLVSIPVESIRGTAVGGGDQRGGDFLPLKPFRGTNWLGRWSRLRRANDRLESLPPIDVVKYDDGYWVTDGHNRVALALYNGQVEIDATIVELVPSGGRRTEPLGSLSVSAAESLSVRAAGAGRLSAEGSPPAGGGEPAEEAPPAEATGSGG
jgi:hypothetical protein